MPESAPTAKRYRDYAVTLREVAKDIARHGNRACLRSRADNDTLATSIENATTARKMQRAFGDHLPESGGLAPAPM